MPKTKKNVATATNRRAKAERRPFRLLHLPNEVQDQVLSNILHLPDFREDDCTNQYTIKDVLSSGILSTCTSLRQRCLRMIQDEFAWIRFSSTKTGIRDDPRDQDFHTTTVPNVFRRLIEPSVLTVDIYLGLDTPTSTAERIISHPKKSILFAFCHRTWVEFLVAIQGRASRLAVCCPRPSPAITRVIEPYMLNGLPAVRRSTGVGFYGDVFNGVTKEQMLYMKVENTEEDDLHDLIDLRNRIADLEADNRPETGLHLALFSHRTLERYCFSFLIKPEEGGQRMNFDQVAIRNDIAQLYFEIECKAIQRFYSLYCEQGLEWFRRHERVTGLGSSPNGMGGRWNRDMYEVAFSLREKPRASLHRMIGIALQLDARIKAGLEPRDGNKVSHLLEDHAYACRMREADLYLRIGHRLLGSSASEATLDVPFDDDDYCKAGVPIDEDGYVELHQVEGTGYFWAGHKGLLDAWGGPRILRHLPLAIESTFSPETQAFLDLINGGPSNQTPCGKECNCTVF